LPEIDFGVKVISISLQVAEEYKSLEEAVNVNFELCELLFNIGNCPMSKFKWLG